MVTITIINSSLMSHSGHGIIEIPYGKSGVTKASYNSCMERVSCLHEATKTAGI